MRILVKSPSYNRRLRKSRRGIFIATALTLAALVLTVVTLIKGSGVQDEPASVSVETPIGEASGK